MSIHRREFLSTAAASLATALPAMAVTAPRRPTADRLLLIPMFGGPSQLETFDPKPDAASEIRGPFGSIATRTPGMRFSELFPRLASASNRFAVLRTLHHDAAPVHEIGLKLCNSFESTATNTPVPHMGASLSAIKKQPWAILSDGPLWAGIASDHGQTSAGVGSEFRRQPAFTPTTLRGKFARAVTLLETGHCAVTVNPRSNVFTQLTWDCHSESGALNTTLDDYRTTLAPEFDLAFSELLESLEMRGLLERTLVVAVGEFGRTPRLNSQGGRDHWAGCWSALVAGGGIRGGACLGESDAIASEPRLRPIGCPELTGTIARALGVPTQQHGLDELFC